MKRYLRERFIFYLLAMRGMAVEHRLAFSRQFQYDDMDSIQAYQQKQLSGLLKHFINKKLINVEPAFSLSTASGLPSIISKLPLMDKARLVNVYLQLREQNPSLGRVTTKYTSGSSGNPVIILKNNQGIACELAASWRSYEWAGIQPGDKGIRVWGRKAQLLQRAKQFLPDVILNRTRISAFGFDYASLAVRLESIRRKNPKYIYGYTSIVREFARVAVDNHMPPIPGLAAVFTTAEPLDESSKKTIEEGFKVRCFDEYGCSEVGSIAHECEQGSLHIMAENLIVETIDQNGEPVFEEQGELVVTDLTNLIMPIIRYRTGDYGVLSKEKCSCGRGLPVLKSVFGRVEDMLITPDNLSHHPASVCYIVDEINNDFNCIKQYQVIQQSPSTFTLHIVPLDNVAIEPKKVAIRFQALLRQRLHPEIEGHVAIEVSIDREQSGKYRLVRRDFLH